MLALQSFGNNFQAFSDPQEGKALNKQKRIVEILVDELNVEGKSVKTIKEYIRLVFDSATGAWRDIVCMRYNMISSLCPCADLILSIRSLENYRNQDLIMAEDHIPAEAIHIPAMVQCHIHISARRAVGYEKTTFPRLFVITNEDGQYRMQLHFGEVRF